MKIKIKYGIDCFHCHWFKDDSGCVFGWNLESRRGPFPGPECKPGIHEFALVESPEAHAMALKAAVEEAYKEGQRAAEDVLESMKRDAAEMGEKIERLQNALDSLIKWRDWPEVQAAFALQGLHGGVSIEVSARAQVVWDEAKEALEVSRGL